MLTNRIVFYVIYLLLFCDQILKFVEVWNIYCIRKQKNRFNVVQEKSFYNFFYSKVSVRNYRVDCSEKKKIDLQLNV